MEETKLTRPDLSFITSKSFNSFSDYVKWICNLSEEQEETVKTLMHVKLPQLVICAEMLFDMHQDKPESIVFKIASETLNEKKQH